MNKTQSAPSSSSQASVNASISTKLICCCPAIAIAVDLFRIFCVKHTEEQCPISCQGAFIGMQVARPFARAAASFHSVVRSRQSIVRQTPSRVDCRACNCTCNRTPAGPAIGSLLIRTYSAKATASTENHLEGLEEDVDLFGEESETVRGKKQDTSIIQDEELDEIDLEPVAAGGSREPSSSSSTSKYDLLDPRPKLPGSIKRLNRILSRQRKIEIPESDLDEKFVKGRGPGGQAINKTNSSVSLTHIPTGIRVQAQPTRSREENRKAARRILAERLEVLRTTGHLPGSEIIQGIEIQFPQQHTNSDTAQMDSAAIADGKVGLELGEVKGKGKKATQKEEEKSLSTAYTKAEIRAEKERRRKANRAKKAKKKYGKKGEEDAEADVEVAGENENETLEAGPEREGVSASDSVETVDQRSSQATTQNANQ
ncbi:hypothetical protein IAT40_006146 [Kwoniella sp. CBS 6097]